MYVIPMMHFGQDEGQFQVGEASFMINFHVSVFFLKDTYCGKHQTGKNGYLGGGGKGGGVKSVLATNATSRAQRKRLAGFLDILTFPIKPAVGRKVIRSMKVLSRVVRDGPGNKPADFLQWMTDDAKGDEQDQTFIQLKMRFAAIHTSAATPMQLIYDLCMMPEYIGGLREEIESACATRSPTNKQALMQLPKLDSFMKESQRFNPLLLGKSCL